MLKQEFEWYLQHQEELVAKYLNKFLVIKDKQVVGVFDNQQSAYATATKKHELGTFIIQQVLPGEQGHSQTFHSRVVYYTPA
jgi:hypothetical protein